MSVIWHRSRDIAEIDDGSGDRFAVLSLAADRPVVLTGTAARIWRLIDGTRTQAEVLAELLAAFPGASEKDVAGELDDFLIGLRSGGLAEARGA